MHIAFIAYGERNEVERLFRDMECQKYQLKLTKEGEPDKHVWLTGQVRVLPFGVTGYVFPKEYKDLVINTMSNQKPNRYGTPNFLNLMFKKALKLESLPTEYNKSQMLLWCIENVSIMLIGIRHDGELVEGKDMGYKGWTHESI